VKEVEKEKGGGGEEAEGEEGGGGEEVGREVYG
jgi:hypothetical protein